MARHRSKNKPPTHPEISLQVAFSAMHRRCSKKLYKLFRLQKKSVELLCVINYISLLKGIPAIGRTQISEAWGDNINQRKITKNHMSHLVTLGFLFDKPTSNGGTACGLTPKGKTVVNYYIEQFRVNLASGEDMLNAKPTYTFANGRFPDNELGMPENEVEFLVDFFNRAKEESQKEFLNRIIKEL